MLKRHRGRKRADLIIIATYVIVLVRYLIVAYSKWCFWKSSFQTTVGNLK